VGNDPERISATRRIPAPAGRIFAVVTDPQGHVDIDGSGYLVARTAGRRLTGVGDVFEIDMYRDATGAYHVINTVTRFEPDAVLEWRPQAPDKEPIGHVWGYTLVAADGGTDVTSYYDWSAVSDEWKVDRQAWLDDIRGSDGMVDDDPSNSRA
jgi:hypothetical protein